MRKKDELTNPNSCMSRAKDDEWTFVLLGRDKAATVAIRAWIDERIRLGKNSASDPQIIEAELWINAVEIEQQNGKIFIKAPIQPEKNYGDFSSGFTIDSVEIDGHEGGRYGYWYAIGGAWCLRGENFTIPEGVSNPKHLILVDGIYGWMN